MGDSEHSSPEPISMEKDKTYEILGRIVRVLPKTDSKNTFFIVHTMKLNQDFTLMCPYFAPVCEGDSIYALCMYDPSITGNYGYVLRIIRPPFVQAAGDKDTILRIFLTVLRKTGFGPARAHDLYNFLIKQAGSEDRVVSFLSELAALWIEYKDSDMLLAYKEIVKVEQMKKLLLFWHKNRSLRRLYLFGLTNREIEACKMPLDKIYDACLKNPYVLIGLSLEKCDELLLRQNKQGTPFDRRCGLIVRKIANYLHEKAWTGVPLHHLQYHFQDINEFMEHLKKEYGIVVDFNTAYLPYPYRVETTIASKIQNLLTPVEITTLAEHISDDPNVQKQIEPIFHMKTLTEEQKRAITGALNSRLSIITGGPGSGKCLNPETHVLLFDGNIKFAKDVKVGDYLMGDDSTARKVLSTCSGEDDMYEITPIKGRPFTCNEPHMLTLKGIEPYIEVRKDRTKKYSVRHSESGVPKCKAFATKNEANEFIDSLNEDIFDIPLNVYLKQSPKFKLKTYLFHVGVEFPEREIPFDPYIIGVWLGDGSSNIAEITNIDREIIKYLEETLPQYNLALDKHNPGKIRYNIVGAGDNYRKKGKNLMTNVLRDLDLLNNKHIPDIYKINSRSIRLKLLAGLIDTDGYMDRNCLEIIQKNDRLANDIEYLAFSLGFMVTKTKVKKSCMYKGEKREGVYNLLHIFGDGLEDIPVLLERKKCHAHEQKKRATCLSFEVKSLGKGQYCGFTLDGNGRFLLGDFLVTHNTKTISELASNLEFNEIQYIVASFTGKAVARIREVIKRKSPATLHRLIARASFVPRFYHLIIDEASMVTCELMHKFFKAFPYDYKITFIGDVNQLPPIEFGTLLEQLMKCSSIPVYSLNKNMRVEHDGLEDTNGILLNATNIINLTVAPSDKPFSLTTCDTFQLFEGSIERVFDIVKAMYDSGVPSDDIMITAPYNKELAELNNMFQQIYNEGQKSYVDPTGKLWMLKDRVIMLENCYDIDVMNGQLGTIVDIIEDEGVKIIFGDGIAHLFRFVSKDKKHNEDVLDSSTGEEVHDPDESLNCSMIALAWSISIHRSQGSEWPYVIIYLPSHSQNKTFVNRNMIYTAITRAKRAVWIVTPSVKEVTDAVLRPCQKRCDNLAQRIMTVPNTDAPAITKEIPL